MLFGPSTKMIKIYPSFPESHKVIVLSNVSKILKSVTIFSSKNKFCNPSLRVFFHTPFNFPFSAPKIRTFLLGDVTTIAVSGQALCQRWERIVICSLRNKTDNPAIWRAELARAIELVKQIRRKLLGRSTDMRRVTTGICSEKCVVRRFRLCANIYLQKLDSTVQPTTHLLYMVQPTVWYSLTQYCAVDKIEKNEMGWACGAYG